MLPSAISRRCQSRVGPTNVMARCHAPSRMTWQFADRRVAITLICRNAAKAAPQVMASRGGKASRIEQTGKRLFSAALPSLSRFWNTHSTSFPTFSARGSERSSSRAGLPIGRVERPVLVVSSRRQCPRSSISRHLSAQASSRRKPVKAINRNAATVVGDLSPFASSTFPRALNSSVLRVRSFASPLAVSTPRVGLGPGARSRFSKYSAEIGLAVSRSRLVEPGIALLAEGSAGSIPEESERKSSGTSRKRSPTFLECLTGVVGATGPAPQHPASYFLR